MPTKAVAWRDLIDGKKRPARRRIVVLGRHQPRRKRPVQVQRRPVRDVGVVPLPTRIHQYHHALLAGLCGALRSVAESLATPPEWQCPPHRWYVNDYGQWQCAECQDSVKDADRAVQVMRAIAWALVIGVIAFAASSVGR